MNVGNRLAKCGYTNRYTEDACAECGGPNLSVTGKELATRLAAVMQTADLHHTSLAQLLTRLRAESGTPELFPMLPAAKLETEVARLVQTHGGSWGCSLVCAGDAELLRG